MSIKKLTRTAAATMVLLMVMAAGSWANQAIQPAPKLVMDETSHSFDPVVDGAKVDHDFVVRNDGDDVLNITKVKTG